MKYHFKFGRGKKIIISGNESFESLGFQILEEYNINPDHLFCFEFANGDSTDSASPLGAMHDGNGNVSIETKIKNRKMEIGEQMTFVYDFGKNWTRNITLDKIE